MTCVFHQQTAWKNYEEIEQGNTAFASMTNGVSALSGGTATPTT